MSKVLVIGCGGVAGVAIRKCAQNDEVFSEICIASRTLSKCEAVKAELEGKTKAVITTAKVDADKVAKIKENLLKNADVNFKSNSYWMNYLDEYIYTGVDFLTDYKKTVSAVTPEKVAAYLKILSGAGNRIEVVMLPEK